MTSTASTPARTRTPGDVGGTDDRAADTRAVPGAPAAPVTVDRSRRRLPWLLALAAYTVLVGAVVMWPTPVDENARAPLSQLFATLYGFGVPDWFDYGALEKSANAVMFIPFGLLITGMDRRLWWTGVVVPAALSGVAELGQHLLLPERVATWTDVAANTAGAVIGVAIALTLVVTVRGRSASRAARHRR